MWPFSSFLSPRQSEYEQFAKEVIKETETFQENVKQFAGKDWKVQQSLIAFDYFKKWACTEKEGEAPTELFLRGTNHRLTNYPFYDDPTDPMWYSLPPNQWLVRKTIYSSLDLKKIDHNQWEGLKIGLETDTLWEPANQVRYEGQIKFVQVGVINLSKDPKELVDGLREFEKRAQAAHQIIKNVMGMHNREKEAPTELDNRSEKAAQSPRGSVPQYIYDNTPLFAQAFEERMNEWKRNLPQQPSTFVRAYQLNASNLNELGNAFHGNMQAVWGSDDPESVRIFTEQGGKIFRPEGGDPNKHQLINRFPTQLEAMNQRISSIFDGVIFTSSIQPIPDSVGYCHLYAYRDISLNTNPYLATLISKISISARQLTLEQNGENQAKKSRSIEELKKKRIFRPAIAPSVSYTEPSEQWQKMATKFMNGYFSFYQMIQTQKLAEKAAGWSVVEFDHNLSENGMNLRGFLGYFMDDPSTVNLALTSATVPLTTKPISLPSLSNEERNKLFNFLLDVSNRPEHITIKMSNAHNHHDLSQVVFQAYLSLQGENGTLTKDPKRTEELAAKMEHFYKCVEGIKEELSILLSSFDLQAAERPIINLPSQTIEQDNEDGNGDKHMEFNAEGLVDLKNTFDTLFFPGSSFTLTAFPLPNSPWNGIKEFMVNYQAESNHYQFKGTLLNPIPLLSMNNEIAEQYRLFSHTPRDVPVRLENNYGLPSTDTNFPSGSSMVVEQKIPSNLPADELKEKLLTLWNATHSIERSIR